MNALMAAINTKFRTLSLYPEVSGLYFDEAPSGVAFPWCTLYQPNVAIQYFFVPSVGAAAPNLEEGEYQFTIRGVGAANVSAYLRTLWTGFGTTGLTVTGATNYRVLPLSYNTFGTGLRDGTGQPVFDGIARFRFDISA
jgi:hypothetical protein